MLRLVISVCLLMPNLALAHSDSKSEQTSTVQNSLNVFGIATNIVGAFAAAFNLKAYDRIKASRTETAKALISVVEVFIHGANLVGYESELSEKFAKVTGTEEESTCSWRSPKLVLLNSLSLLHHLTNVLFYERHGFAHLLNFWDLLETFGHANDIRANIGTLQTESDKEDFR